MPKETSNLVFSRLEICTLVVFRRYLKGGMKIANGHEMEGGRQKIELTIKVLGSLIDLCDISQMHPIRSYENDSLCESDTNPRGEERG